MAGGTSHAEADENTPLRAFGNLAAELWHLREVDRGLRRQIERLPARFNHADRA